MRIGRQEHRAPAGMGWHRKIILRGFSKAPGLGKGHLSRDLWSWAVPQGCTSPATPPAEAVPFPRLCYLLASCSSSLFAFPLTTLIPTSVGTLGQQENTISW